MIKNDHAKEQNLDLIKSYQSNHLKQTDTQRLFSMLWFNEWTPEQHDCRTITYNMSDLLCAKSNVTPTKFNFR